jgi:oligopeptide transport system substrate-binding protein
LFSRAGYADPTKFPPVNLLIGVSATDTPELHPKIAEAVVQMWQQTLGVTVKVETLDSKTFFSRIAKNPTEIFRSSIFPNNNDPQDFLKIFHTGAQFNYGGFSNAAFDKAIDQAEKDPDPAVRQVLYIQAEQILCGSEAAILPVYHTLYP